MQQASSTVCDASENLARPENLCRPSEKAYQRLNRENSRRKPAHVAEKRLHRLGRRVSVSKRIERLAENLCIPPESVRGVCRRRIGV